MKTSNKKNNGIARSVLAVFTSLAIAFAAFVGGPIAAYAAEVDTYTPDFGSMAETEVVAAQVAQQIGEEGAVLLKNNGVLPLADAKNISAFGTVSANLIYGGGGSGRGAMDDTIRDLQDSMNEAGYNLNTALWNYYSSAESDDPAGVAFYEDSFKVFGDAALVFVGRTGSEGGDLDRTGERHYLQLSVDEDALINYVTEKFEKVILVINSSHPLELQWAQNNDKIDAILWIGHPGARGIMAVGGILNGTVNPSGRLSDIYAADFTKDPTYQNFANNDQFEGGSNTFVAPEGAEPYENQFKSSQYEEGIYYGYRFYETAAVEGFINYDEAVVYPFGYGLSYTSFQWSVESKTQTPDVNGKIQITVKVTNIGDVAGKDVVQLYYSAPYIKGEIEKSAVVLGAFAKTDLIQPGESDTVTLELDVYDMASFDYNDANGNGFYGYELDAGKYTLTLQTDSHNVKNGVSAIVYNIAATQYENDPITGNPVKAIFSGVNEAAGVTDAYYDDYISYDETMTHMSRADFAGTFPVTPDQVALTLSQEKYDWMTNYNTYSLDDDAPGQPWYVESVPEGWTQVESHEEGYADVTIKLIDMAGVPLYDPADGNYGNISDEWEAFMNQLTWEELTIGPETGGFETMAIDAVGRAHQVELDGPAQLGGQEEIHGFWFPSAVVVASTWNTELGNMQGTIIGNEALFMNYDGWYAPAMNMHRSPFSGRNFEYYSEDPVHSGKIAAAVVSGATSKGIITFIKHFAGNDQDTDRSGMCYSAFLTEQVLREITLKPFQMAIQEGGSKGIMTAMNRIGYVPCTSNYVLLTEVVRGEWGFDGYITSDSTTTDGFGPGNTITIESAMRTGNDNLLGLAGDYAVLGEWDPAQNCVVYEGVASPTQYVATRMSAMRMLYTGANTVVNANTVDFSGFVAKDLGEVTAHQSLAASAGVGVAFENNATTIIYSLANGTTLPEGLTLNANGSITGTSTAEPGTYTFDVQILTDNWTVRTATGYTITITPAFAIEADSGYSLDLNVGDAFEGNVTSALTSNEITFKLASGSLGGLTLSEDGSLSGTVTEPGTHEFEITITIGVAGRRGTTYTDYPFVGVLTVAGEAADPVVDPSEPVADPTEPSDSTPAPAAPDAMTIVSMVVSIAALICAAVAIFTKKK